MEIIESFAIIDVTSINPAMGISVGYLSLMESPHMAHVPETKLYGCKKLRRQNRNQDQKE